MRDASLMVQADAKRFAPVDTGRLRSSINSEVRREGHETVGAVGSNVKYAVFVEKGTRPHWPPPGALATWARRHGFTSEYLVRRSIGTFGTSKMALRTVGTKGFRYLERAFEKNKSKIIKRIQDAVGGIIK